MALFNVPHPRCAACNTSSTQVILCLAENVAAQCKCVCVLVCCNSATINALINMLSPRSARDLLRNRVAWVVEKHVEGVMRGGLGVDEGGQRGESEKTGCMKQER